VQKEFDESERFKIDNEKLAKERDNLRTESVRLKHRISYLEEQVCIKITECETMRALCQYAL